MDSALELGTGYDRSRYATGGADGEHRWFLTRAVPARDAKGRIIVWFGTSTDIHDRKLAEAERARLLERERAARAEAQEAVRTRDVFLSVSHTNSRRH